MRKPPQHCQPRVAGRVDRWQTGLARLLWPSICLLCRCRGAFGLDLCPACEADLVPNSHACSTCAEPLPVAAEASVCGACLQHPPAFDSGYVPFRYAYPIDHLVRGLKFRGDLACGRVLGELFTARLRARAVPLPELIVPVPLARQRYRQRGFNQANELALPLRRVTRIAVRNDLVIRHRETAEQAALDLESRRKNVRRAFTMAASLPARHVAILDDVVTTGSTVGEVARVLRSAGAERVEVWAICRTGRK
ncbi:MAG: ComF family protein [Steroidobacteraceae bacterium]